MNRIAGVLWKWKVRAGLLASAGVAAGVLGCADGRSTSAPNCREVGFVGEAPPPADPAFNTEEYAAFQDNPYFRVADQPLSTFSIDVDTASYANVRRFLRDGQLPPAGAVRLEEMVNYFPYEYATPVDGRPFAASVEVRPAPWEPKHRLARIGIQGKKVDMTEAPTANLVFLIDVSGSMNEPAKLPLVKKCLRMLVKQLRVRDSVAIVVYAGNSGLVLPPTTGAAADGIGKAIDRLEAGGSTNGGAGIELAYKVATEHFVKGGVNRVILCTDGDFNVGVSSESDLVKLIEEKRKSGVFLSVLGFGTGNYADARMQQLADKGNGNASYIDSLKEGRKVLVEQASGTLVTIAKDVKIQVEFNPAKVAAYRLIGYENRVLANQDFNDDAKDAGEIGAGHQVTALYEIIPAGEAVPGAGVDALKYQTPPAPGGSPSGELCTVKLRYKLPESDTSERFEIAVNDPGAGAVSTPEFDFAASVAAFGMLLRNSPHKGQANWDLVLELAKGGAMNDPGEYRAEFVELVKEARQMSR
ncbi:MAG: VWA domain-containing protein [Planctomycetes bacterium]|nr:VWA domain-containing protein [Planctomycetota bacterium]